MAAQVCQHKKQYALGLRSHFHNKQVQANILDIIYGLYSDNNAIRVKNKYLVLYTNNRNARGYIDVVAQPLSSLPRTLSILPLSTPLHPAPLSWSHPLPSALPALAPCFR